MCRWHNYEKWGEGTKEAEAHRYLATAGAGLAEPATTRIYQCDLPACAQALHVLAAAINKEFVVTYSSG